jgi:hypothetical protein
MNQTNFNVFVLGRKQKLTVTVPLASPTKRRLVSVLKSKQATAAEQNLHDKNSTQKYNSQ